MKKIRVILSAIAFVSAIGAAIGGQFVTAQDGYQYMPGTVPTCEFVKSCSNVPGADCTTGIDVPLGSLDSPSGTSCGTQLKDFR